MAAVLELMEVVDAVLCLRSPGLRLPAHPFQFGAEQVLHLGEFRAQVLHALRAFAEIVVVVAVVGI